MEFPDLESAARGIDIRIDGSEVVGGTAWWQDRTIEVRRKGPSVGSAQRTKSDSGRELAIQHLRSIEGQGPATHKSVATEIVDGHVVGVRPHCQLRVVGEVRAA